jgi:phosphatidyl-myo-inositol dimannoside synthase
MSDAPEKTVLLITRNFPPLVGGMEKLNQRMIEGLAEHFNAVLIAPKGAKQYVPKNAKVYESPSLSLPVFFLYAMLTSIYLAIKMKPGVVLAGSGLTAPFAYIASRAARGKSIVYVHGLDLIAQSFVYQNIWLPCIRRCDAVIANSTNTKQLALEKCVQEHRISIVFPGTDIPELNSENAKQFREKYKLGECPVLLSVGRITERKGLLPFIKHAFPIILAKFPDAKLVIIGSEPVYALKQDKQNITADIKNYLGINNLTDSVVFLGSCDDKTLIATYQAASVHVFPVLSSSSDVEGFGMVAIEAAANGLQTVAFDVGGVADAVINESTGCLVSSNDYIVFADCVIRVLESTDLTHSIQKCRDFSRQRSWIKFQNGILETVGKFNG